MTEITLTTTNIIMTFLPFHTIQSKVLTVLLSKLKISIECMSPALNFMDKDNGLDIGFIDTNSELQVITAPLLFPHFKNHCFKHLDISSPHCLQ
jgi:hypothetical protein